jgi:hypothetical protein
MLESLSVKVLVVDLDQQASGFFSAACERALKELPRPAAPSLAECLGGYTRQKDESNDTRFFALDSDFSAANAAAL